jgi:hypothetical protein
MAHNHQWDDDACCIHCGLDGADMIGYELPQCPVRDEPARAANLKSYQQRLLDNPSMDSWLS